MPSPLSVPELSKIHQLSVCICGCPFCGATVNIKNKNVTRPLGGRKSWWWLSISTSKYLQIIMHYLPFILLGHSVEFEKKHYA